jgi:hypothetical protein
VVDGAYENYLMNQNSSQKIYILMLMIRAQSENCVRLKIGFVDVNLETAKDVSIVNNCSGHTKLLFFKF